MEKRIIKDKTGEKTAVGPKLDKKFEALESSLRDSTAISQSLSALEEFGASFDKIFSLEEKLEDPMVKLTAKDAPKDIMDEISDRIEEVPEGFAEGDEQTIRTEDLLVGAEEIPDADDIDTLLSGVHADAFGMPATSSDTETSDAVTKADADDEEIDDADLVDGPALAEMGAIGVPLPEGFTVLSPEDIARNRSSTEALTPAPQEVAMKKTDKPDAIRQALSSSSDWSDQVEVDGDGTASAKGGEEIDPEFLHRNVMDETAAHDDGDDEGDEQMTQDQTEGGAPMEDDLTAEMRAAAEERAAAEASAMAVARKLEEARAREERILEKKRAQEEAKRAEEARIAEEARLAEEARRAEEERQAEEARIAEEAVLALRARKQAEAAAAERARLEAIAREEEAKEAAERAAREEEDRRLMAASGTPVAEGRDDFDDMLSDFEEIAKPAKPQAAQASADHHNADAWGDIPASETRAAAMQDSHKEDDIMLDEEMGAEEADMSELEQARAKRKAKMLFYLTSTAAAAVIAGVGFMTFFSGPQQPATQIAAIEMAASENRTSDLAENGLGGSAGGADQGTDLAELQDLGAAPTPPEADAATGDVNLAQSGVSLNDLARGLVPETENIDLNDLFLTGQPPASTEAEGEEVVAEVADAPDAEAMAAMELRFEEIGAQIDSVIDGIEERDARLMAMETQLADAMARAERAESLAIAQNQVLVRFVAAEEKLEIAEQLIVDLSRRISSVENFNPADAEVVEAKLTELDTNFRGLQRDVGMVARMAINGSPTMTTGRTAGQPLSNFDRATEASMRTAAATPDAVPASVKVGDHVNGYGTVLEIFGVSDGGRMVVMENGTVVLN